jgi:ribose 5-phosphate isomerase B
MKKIIIASDHAGFYLKEKIIELLNSLQYIVEDAGPYNTESVDYPDFAKKVAEKISVGSFEIGILICGSGIGVSIVANKFKNVRAALCTNVQLAKLSRQHNNAYILCLGERFVKEKNAFMMVKAFLKTEFEGGRHERRVKKIHELTQC